MRKEEAMKVNIALTNLTKFMWKKLRIRKSTDKTKASELIQEVFEKCDESKNVSIEETVEKKVFCF